MNRKRHVHTKRAIPDYPRGRMNQRLEVAFNLPGAPKGILREFFEPSRFRIRLKLLQIIDKFLLILSRQRDLAIKVNRIDDLGYGRQRSRCLGSCA